MRSFCIANASHIFSTKNFSVFGYKLVKHLTSWPLNELVKLTMIWTTGPRAFERQTLNSSKVIAQRCLYQVLKRSMRDAISYNVSYFKTFPIWRPRQKHKMAYTCRTVIFLLYGHGGCILLDRWWPKYISFWGVLVFVSYKFGFVDVWIWYRPATI